LRRAIRGDRNDAAIVSSGNKLFSGNSGNNYGSAGMCCDARALSRSEQHIAIVEGKCRSVLKKAGRGDRCASIKWNDIGGESSSGHDFSGLCALCRAGQERFFEHVLRQVTADEDEFAQPLFPRLPLALEIAIKEHVNPLEHKSPWLVLKSEYALRPQKGRSLPLYKVLEPGQEFFWINVAIDG
jgi:hypothetical protein